MVRRCGILVIPGLVAACATAMEMPRGSEDAGVDGRGSQTVADAGTTTPDAPGQSTSCANAFSGVLATWNFAGATGNQVSTAAESSATGIVAGAISRAGVTATSGAGSINSSNWATNAQRDPAKYYTFTLTPPSGCTLTLTSASIDGRSSSTGPTQAVLATSADAFAATTPVSTTAPSAPTFTVTASTSAVELRVYGFAASSTGGTFRLQNTLTVSGSLQ